MSVTHAYLVAKGQLVIGSSITVSKGRRMNSQEKTMIDQLFQQLRTMESGSAPIDAEANRHIENHIRQHPTAPYYMTQLLLLQKESLANAKRELEQLRAENPYEREAVQRDSWIEGQGFLAGAI